MNEHDDSFQATLDQEDHGALASIVLQIEFMGLLGGWWR